MRGRRAAVVSLCGAQGAPAGSWRDGWLLRRSGGGASGPEETGSFCVRLWGQQGLSGVRGTMGCCVLSSVGRVGVVWGIQSMTSDGTDRDLLNTS